MPDPVNAAQCAIYHNVSLTQDLYRYLKFSFQNECISDFFKGFYNYFYDNGYDYDINGFSLIFFMPPHLSGFSWPDPYTLINPSGGGNGYSYLDFITFALEITPADVAVEKGSLGIIGTETFDYPTNIKPGSEISLTYLDSSDLKLYTFHSIWVRYIHAVISGRVNPTREMGGREYSSDSDDNPDDDDIIDYVGSLYILKFDSDMQKPRMIAKALGIFPNAVPFKEQIGPKGQHQVTISNVSYTCAYFYEEHIPEKAISGSEENRMVLFNEFMTIFGKAFESLNTQYTNQYA